MKTTVIRRPKHWLLQLILGGVGVLSLLVFGILCAVAAHISSPLLHQQGAARWQGDGTLRYDQVSVFRSAAEGLNAQKIEAAGTSIETELNKAGSPNASYLIAYGAETTIQATSQNGRSDAALMLVGGDFFRIHGFTFLAGTGFLPDDVMQDRVVLDELAAWQLFSSDNCVGLSMTMNGREYYVAGVVAIETDDASAACYGDKPRIYASYTGWPVAEGDAALPVTFCEGILPEPVDEFALATFATAIGVDKDEVVDNTDRFTVPALWSNLRGLHMQGILSNAVVYPWWESAARLAANRRSLLLVPMAMALLVPLGWGVWGAVCLYRLIRAGGRGVVQLADNVVERRRTRNYIKAQALKRQAKERNEQYADEQSVEAGAVPAAGSHDAADGAQRLR